MARGGPDWGQNAGTEIIGSLLDLGEAIARIGSISLFDRRGNVVWYDDFEFGLQNWVTQAAGAGGSVSWVTDKSRIGRYSIALVAGTTAGKFALMHHTLPYEIRGKFGVEFAYTLPQGTNNLNAVLTLAGAGFSAFYGFKIPGTSSDITYLGADGLYHSLGQPFTPDRTGLAFNVIKVVIDLDAGTYVRFIGNGLEYAVTLAGENPFGAIKPNYVDLQLTHNGQASQNFTVYIDDVIFTINEP